MLPPVLPNSPDVSAGVPPKGGSFEYGGMLSNDPLPSSATAQGKWSRDLAFSLIARDSRLSAVILAAMVVLATVGSIGLANGPGLSVFVVVTLCFVALRFRILEPYRGAIPEASQGDRIERGFALLSALIGLSFGFWAVLLILGEPRKTATIVMATATANLIAVPFLAACVPAYLGMTLPMMMVGLVALWLYPLPLVTSFSVMFVVSYVVAVRMLFVHRHAILAKLAEESRREALDRQHHAMMANESVAIAVSEGLKMCSGNAKLFQMLGVQDGVVQGDRGMVELASGFGFSEPRLARVLSKVVARARRKGVVKIGLAYRSSGRAALWLKIEARLADAGSPLARLLWLVTDATANKKAHDELSFLAQHDALTGLANRHQFTSRARHALQQARIHGDTLQRPDEASSLSPVRGAMMAVLCIDLDGFKAVNDRFGHSVGDEVLVVIGKRLSHAVRTCDVVARFGGDEFTVLLQQVESRADVAQVAEKIADLICSPIEINDLIIRVGASVGLALGPEDGVQVEELLVRADKQMYATKQALRLTMGRRSGEMHP